MVSIIIKEWTTKIELVPAVQKRNAAVLLRKPGRLASQYALYDIHRLILKQAGIPYIGSGYGPRIHDWRHTFAVKAFKQMIDQGLDMYVALPILSTYLGHKTIYATERYVRLTMDLYPYLEEKCSDKFNQVFRKAVETNETD